jgi:hypothetical protein
MKLTRTMEPPEKHRHPLVLSNCSIIWGERIFCLSNFTIKSIRYWQVLTGHDLNLRLEPFKVIRQLESFQCLWTWTNQKISFSCMSLLTVPLLTGRTCSKSSS